MGIPFDEGELTCPACGRVWDLTKHHIIQREPDTLECKCGKTLHQWRGACYYTAELLKGLPEDEKPKVG
jgi:hypothetical protein